MSPCARYNVETTQDGLVGEEGTFSICTFWACEAAARLGMFKKEYLEKGRLMFEQMLGYSNHLGEEKEEESAHNPSNDIACCTL